MKKSIPHHIAKSGLTIYDSLEDRLDLYYSTEELEKLLDSKLRGVNVDFENKTRSKFVKSRICEILGYPVPKRFSRTTPQFPGQNFQTYVQKSNNMQIWNAKVQPDWRYVIVRPDERNIISKVRVVTGQEIAAIETTGKLTHKYQAKSRHPITQSQLVSASDTKNMLKMAHRLTGFIPIAAIFKQLRKLEGATILKPSVGQERNRGSFLHDEVNKIFKAKWRDDGQFPDIKEQLIELKLQTASTIDLGLVLPDGNEMLSSVPGFRHCDTRYVVFYAEPLPTGVRLKNVIVVTGEDFFGPFLKFGGNVKNSKYQIRIGKLFA